MLALLQAMIPESHKSGHGMAKTGRRGSRWVGEAPCGNRRRPNGPRVARPRDHSQRHTEDAPEKGTGVRLPYLPSGRDGKAI